MKRGVIAALLWGPLRADLSTFPAALHPMAGRPRLSTADVIVGGGAAIPFPVALDCRFRCSPSDRGFDPMEFAVHRRGGRCFEHSARGHPLEGLLFAEDQVVAPPSHRRGVQGVHVIFTSVGCRGSQTMRAGGPNIHLDDHPPSEKAGPQFPGKQVVNGTAFASKFPHLTLEHPVRVCRM